eukprot:2547704-Prymnesium_polylepis.1
MWICNDRWLANRRYTRIHGNDCLPLPLPSGGRARSKITAPPGISTPPCSMRRESSAKFLRAHSTARTLGSPSAEQRSLDTSTDEAMESSKKLVFC